MLHGREHHRTRQRQFHRPLFCKCHLHRFRHTFAVNHYVANKDLLNLQRIMGHKDLSTTINVYLRWLPDTELQSQINATRIELNKRVDRFNNKHQT